MAKNKPKYFPLQVLSEFDDIMNWKYKDIREELKEKFMAVDIPENKEEYVKEMVKLEFHPFNFRFPYAIYGAYERMLRTGIIQEEFNYSDMKDLILYPTFMEIWSENKQVYKPDNEFLDALYKTENFNLCRDDLEHLPTNCFWLDLEEYNNSFNGALVHVLVNSIECYLTIYCFSKQNSSFYSNYFCLGFSQDGTLNTKALNQMISNYSKEALTEIAFDPDTGEPIKRITTEEYTFKPSDICHLVMQILCYMTSKEPDIHESQKTKLSYRKPTGEPKNSFKEVQIHEVGVKYGRSIRAFAKQEVKRLKETESTNDIDIKRLGYKRRSPRLHYRCAHWQRYRVGKGRTQIVTKWIEPVYVGIGSKSTTDVIIHKVKK